MEKRQLNLNAPLLSARRYSSPLKSSEFVKGQVTQTQRHHTGAATASEWGSEVVMMPAGIPFQWEQSPGRPKDDIGTGVKCANRRSLDAFRHYRSGELPRAPPGGMSRFSSGERVNDHSIHRPQVEAFSFNDHAVLLEKLSESLNCDEGNGSQSGQDAYSDALDMLSSEESGALNKNFSGGVIGDHHSSVDTQTRDLMMNRFLQAAKAAVVETPKYDVKKPLVVIEVPKKKSVSSVISASPKRNMIPYDNPNAHNGESEDEQERRVPVKRSGKLSWWILPRFCVKNTLRLLNPLPAFKSKKLMTPSLPKAIAGARFSRNAQSGPLDRSGCPAPDPPKKKFYSGLLPRDLISNENKLTYDSHYSYKPELSQLRRYRSGNLSPYRNESPMSPFRDGAAFLPPPKEVDSANANKIASSRKIFNAFRHVSRGHSKHEKRSGRSARETVEKTVYIDKSSYNRKTRHLEDAKARGFTVQDSGIPDAKLSKGVRKPIPDTRKELVKSPLPPPLPNSPSESWLWKTLPSIPSEKAFISRSHLQSKQQQIPKGRSLDPSWEAIVKFSNLGQQHRPYSQEFVPRSSHRQSTS